MENRKLHPSTNKLHKDLFSFIQQAATIGTWEYDVKTDYLIWSKVTKDIHDVSPNYTPKISNAINYYKEGSSRDIITEAFKNAINNNIKYDLELEIITKKGVQKWVRAIGYPLFKNKKCFKVYGLFQDITSSKTAESNIKSLLKTTIQQNKRLLNFAHIVSHNLRSHTGNFSLLLNLMEEDYPSIATNEYFPMLKKASLKLNETIANLNEVAQINLKLKETSIKINVLKEVRQITQSLSGEIKKTETTINLNIPEEYYIKIIPAYFESIIVNLISNSIKYRQKNLKPIIDISLKNTTVYTILKYKDNGLGIDLKLHKDKIFGMYKTFHKNKNSRGLGLFLIKNQIESMEGKIDVSSQINNGTTFYIYFKND